LGGGGDREKGKNNEKGGKKEKFMKKMQKIQTRNEKDVLY
jgi:hypothetical protein